MPLAFGKSLASACCAGFASPPLAAILDAVAAADFRSSLLAAVFDLLLFSSFEVFRVFFSEEALMLESTDCEDPDGDEEEDDEDEDDEDDRDRVDGGGVVPLWRFRDAAAVTFFTAGSFSSLSCCGCVTVKSICMFLASIQSEESSTSIFCTTLFGRHVVRLNIEHVQDCQSDHFSFTIIHRLQLSHATQENASFSFRFGFVDVCVNPAVSATAGEGGGAVLTGRKRMPTWAGCADGGGGGGGSDAGAALPGRRSLRDPGTGSKGLAVLALLTLSSTSCGAAFALAIIIIPELRDFGRNRRMGGREGASLGSG